MTFGRHHDNVTSSRRRVVVSLRRLVVLSSCRRVVASSCYRVVVHRVVVSSCRHLVASSLEAGDFMKYNAMSSCSKIAGAFRAPSSRRHGAGRHSHRQVRRGNGSLRNNSKHNKYLIEN